MIQEQLFAVPSLGPCITCGKDATLKSPSGTLYCGKHGYCERITCLRSVEKFVWHERLKIWCCPCVVQYEERMREDADNDW